MYLDLPKGAKEYTVPDSILKLIPKNYIIEMAELEDGLLSLSLIKIKHVDCKLSKADLIMSDDDLKAKILNPMMGIFKNA